MLGLVNRKYISSEEVRCMIVGPIHIPFMELVKVIFKRINEKKK